MKTLISLAAILIVLTSCGKSYLVRNVENDHYGWLEQSEVGSDLKEGDTVRTQHPWRVPVGKDSTTVMMVNYTLVVEEVR